MKLHPGHTVSSAGPSPSLKDDGHRAADAVSLEARHVPASSPRMRQAVNVLVVVGTALFTAFLLSLGAFWALTVPWLQELAQEHFAAMAGLPLAAIASLVIVVLLEARFDHVEMRLFGGFVEFSGASGPVVLWGFCFASITGAIKLLW